MWFRFVRIIRNKSLELLQPDGKHSFCIVSGTNFTAADNVFPVVLRIARLPYSQHLMLLGLLEGTPHSSNLISDV